MVQLQQPDYVFMGGALRPWREATLHVGCEAVTRNVNVFEGLKGYWQPDGTFAVVQLRAHYERLCRSARLLHIPWSGTFESYRNGVSQLAQALVERGRDMWFRTTLFAVEGHWGEDTVADLVITAYHQEQRPPPSIALGVSTWRRSPDVSLPARAKTGSNYQVARLARIEGRAHGCQDMVLLNASGRVAEATGSCIVMVRDGTIVSPPASEGALESITLGIVEKLARSAGIPFERRPIDRTELLVAEEIALCGTLAELILVHTFERMPLDPHAPVLSALQDRYFHAVRSISPHPAVELTPVAGEARALAGTTATRRATGGNPVP